MRVSKEQLFALLGELERLPPPRHALDAARAKLLGLLTGDADAAFERAVETLFALAEEPRLQLDAVSAVIEVIADVTGDPRRGSGLTAALRIAPPPAAPQQPRPGSLSPVRPPPVVTSKKSKTMPRVLSYGGGLDSFAILVRSIEINDKPDVAIFMDVAGGTEKKDSPAPGEWPGTYRHIREVVIPMCKKAGIEFVWLGPQIPVRGRPQDAPGGAARSLFEWMENRGQIPVSGPDRICTIVAKVERFEEWMKQRSSTQPVEVWVGFEAGEEDRINKDPNVGKSTQRKNRFPLAEWKWCRCRAEQYVRSKKLPVPRKSACVFCPYGQMSEWQTFARELPEQFKMVERMEAKKLAKPTARGVRMALKGYTKLVKGELPAKAVEGVHYKAKPLRVYIQGTARPKIEKCDVCGAYPKATKQVGCDYLP